MVGSVHCLKPDLHRQSIATVTLGSPVLDDFDTLMLTHTHTLSAAYEHMCMISLPPKREDWDKWRDKWTERVTDRDRDRDREKGHRISFTHQNIIKYIYKEYSQSQNIT